MPQCCGAGADDRFLPGEHAIIKKLFEWIFGRVQNTDSKPGGRSSLRTRGSENDRPAQSDGFPLLEDCDVLVITILDEEYQAAVQAILDGKYAERRSGNIDFAVGACPSKQGPSGGINVAIACVGAAGASGASSVASLSKHSIPNADYLIVCGIAGAIPNFKKPENHVRRGDIIVSNRTPVNVLFGKDHPQGFEGRTEIEIKSPDQGLISIARGLERNRFSKGTRWEEIAQQAALELNPPRTCKTWDRPENDILYDYDPNTGKPTESVGHPDADTGYRRTFENRPKIHFGLILSSDRVQGNPKIRDEIAANHPGALCFEMEAAGIARGASLADWRYLIVRGGNDYCDGAKDDNWMSYAALIAAAFSRCIIENIQPVRQTPYSQPSFPFGSGAIQAVGDGSAQLQRIDLPATDPSARTNFSEKEFLGYVDDMREKLESGEVAKALESVDIIEQIARTGHVGVHATLKADAIVSAISVVTTALRSKTLAEDEKALKDRAQDLIEFARSLLDA